ncbi:XdhC family protein [Georgenia sp. Z1491]|uniref:XdhC family protein n=1 Tax=Georgenia sp. Z1491 TaxID=3416707 RepID=UPI003CF46F87
MAFDTSGRVVGSVSGGCVEGDLYLRCQEAHGEGHTGEVTVFADSTHRHPG